MEVVSTYKYNRIKEIGVGQGKHSNVYLAHDPQIDGHVAVKEIEKARFPRPITEFFAEAQAMFKSEHPNIVAIRVASESTTHICLSMPFYSNGSLTDRISQGPLPLFDVQSLGQDILAGLEAIHVAGHIHFDIKPSNVLYSDTNRAMIADFGQSRPIGSGGMTVVPLMYKFAIPPEFFSGIADLRCDIYQVGLTLYRAVNGDPFFFSQRDKFTDDAALKAAITSGRFPSRQLFMPHVPKRLRTVIRKAMSVNPTERYASASEFAVALGSAGIGLNWKATIGPADIVWRAERIKRPSLVVAVTQNGALWNTTIHADGRRKCATEQALWKPNCSHKAAMKHLKGVFETLG